MALVKTYLGTLVAFTIIDSVWLGAIAPDFYNSNIGHLMADEVNWGAALAFYLLYIVGIVKFGIISTATDKGWLGALMNGALFGFIAYATYDLTNYATLKDWPVIVVVVDMLWGAFITGSSAAIGFLLHQKWNVTASNS